MRKQFLFCIELNEFLKKIMKNKCIPSQFSMIITFSSKKKQRQHKILFWCKVYKQPKISKASIIKLLSNSSCSPIYTRKLMHSQFIQENHQHSKVAYKLYTHRLPTNWVNTLSLRKLPSRTLFFFLHPSIERLYYQIKSTVWCLLMSLRCVVLLSPNYFAYLPNLTVYPQFFEFSN